MVNYHSSLANGKNFVSIVLCLDGFLFSRPGCGLFHPVLPGGLTLDDDRAKRGASPGSGASTAYHNFNLIAKRKLHAGEELFVDRGQSNRWPSLPAKKIYTRADEIVADLVAANIELTEAQWIGKQGSFKNHYSFRPFSKGAFLLRILLLQMFCTE
jgi:hypothetical protein